MNLRHHTKNDSRAIVQLFASVFADSEGEAEGVLIGRLAKDLFEKGATGLPHGQVASAHLISVSVER